MPDWTPSADYRKIADANRAFYGQTARQYEATETCVIDPGMQQTLSRDLDRVVSALDRPPETLQALDACGGTGNVALKLLEKGVRQTTLADITPELTDLFRAKCQERGFSADVVHSEIAHYLAAHPGRFDLIVFSSALHHLQDIPGVLDLAVRALAPGGILMTCFDPTLRSQNPALGRLLLRLDYYLFKVLDQTADLPAALRRRWNRFRQGASVDRKMEVAIDENTVGMLAEFHVEKGIPDTDLVARLQQVHPVNVVFHEREASARHGWILGLLRRLGTVTTFKMALQKPR